METGRSWVFHCLQRWIFLLVYTFASCIMSCDDLLFLCLVFRFRPD